MEKNLSQTGQFAVEKEYMRCFEILQAAKLLINLPRAQKLGVIGVDGKEYILPTQKQIVELFANNSDLVTGKIAQGFDRLELVPLALPIPTLIEAIKKHITKLKNTKNIFQTRETETSPWVPLKVNDEKLILIWDKLREVMDSEEMIYFPQNFSAEHGGQTKSAAANDRRICAFPGWSVGLVESQPIMAQKAQGQTLSGRKQLEVGLLPEQYLEILRGEEYEGETGKTLEDFLMKFLALLQNRNQISNDVSDNNAMWCLANYLKDGNADMVTTGRWFRSVGRMRLDMHRTNDKECSESWGAATTVRLPGKASILSADVEIKDYYAAYSCPNCQGSLAMEGNTLVCLNNHSFDIAKEGYVNLILANQKKSLISGDGKEMIQARDKFLKEGYYDFLMKKILELAKKDKMENILEIGCGSGFYLNGLTEELKPDCAHGSDVSKDAIKFCAKKYKNCHFSVNNSFNLSFKENFFDLILSVFSPFDTLEIERVLKKSGVFVLVRPGKNHLIELYDLIGMPTKDKTAPEFANLKLVESKEISQKSKITEHDLNSLIAMSPLSWKIQKSNLEKIILPEITFDFTISVYEKEQN